MSLLTDLASPLPQPRGCIASKVAPVYPTHDAVPASHPVAPRSLPAWMAHRRPQGVLSLPFIYWMCVPLVALDLWISVYQALSFPLLGIEPVRRRDHFTDDQERRRGASVVEKAHFAYCSYARGVLSYAGEITARTEQYWRPVRHGRLAAIDRDRDFPFLAHRDGARRPPRPPFEHDVATADASPSLH